MLVGSREQRILDEGHDRLSTYNLLAEHDRKDVRDWIEQLVEQEFLEKTGEYTVLRVTPEGRQLLRGEVTPQLLKPAGRPRRESKAAIDSWEGVDRGLFEALRAWRRRKAAERGVPPFIVFGDATLRDLARARPATPERLLAVHGIGEKKCAEYGGRAVGRDRGLRRPLMRRTRWRRHLSAAWSLPELLESLRLPGVYNGLAAADSMARTHRRESFGAPMTFIAARIHVAAAGHCRRARCGRDGRNRTSITRSAATISRCPRVLRSSWPPGRRSSIGRFMPTSTSSGRLYVCESSGTNDNVEKQLAEKPHRILRLEDTDGDGRFDRTHASSPTS